jgi:hypothetical protein
MKKTLKGKLSLSRETVRTLSSLQLEGVEGGVTIQPTRVLNTCAASVCAACSTPCTTF